MSFGRFRGMVREHTSSSEKARQPQVPRNQKEGTPSNTERPLPAELSGFHSSKATSNSEPSLPNDEDEIFDDFSMTCSPSNRNGPFTSSESWREPRIRDASIAHSLETEATRASMNSFPFEGASLIPPRLTIAEPSSSRLSRDESPFAILPDFVPMLEQDAVEFPTTDDQHLGQGPDFQSSDTEHGMFPRSRSVSPFQIWTDASSEAQGELEASTRDSGLRFAPHDEESSENIAPSFFRQKFSPSLPARNRERDFERIQPAHGAQKEKSLFSEALSAKRSNFVDLFTEQYSIDSPDLGTSSRNQTWALSSPRFLPGSHKESHENNERAASSSSWNQSSSGRSHIGRNFHGFCRNERNKAFKADSW
ncbi:hypothetical protein IE53DRAFT_106462 [Violaceomyces palustris]|uniref:Uncharacterized protein n=1 Tax=Violaceomyces palustris TaxID=1673888 RepID=A0ACD0NWJ5_9BASI|nr:hypothetical protein IE53DRAFT_106462 [Violaceomyces palustris]